MSEVRLIDANALKDEILSWAMVITNPKILGTDDTMCVINYAPTVDAVEVVRCRDCKWFDITEPSGTIEPIGYRCRRKRIFVESDDYCKYGEKRNDGDNH